MKTSFECVIYVDDSGDTVWLSFEKEPNKNLKRVLYNLGIKPNQLYNKKRPFLRWFYRRNNGSS